MSAATMSLRPGGPADLEAIAVLWLAAWQATMPDIDFACRLPWFHDHMAALMRNDYRLTCATDDSGGVVGFTAVRDSDGHLDQIAVHPAQWGTDAAGALIADAKRRAGRLVLDVNQDNPRAVRFYERHGFHRLRADVNPTSGRATWWYGWP